MEIKQRTVAINDEKKVFRGETIKDIVRKVEKAFPQIENWLIYHYEDKPGVYLHGDNDEGDCVTIPDV